LITRFWIIVMISPHMGAIQIVAFLLWLWAVRTPPTAVCPGWCPLDLYYAIY
jgi:hypothetical protein